MTLTIKNVYLKFLKNTFLAPLSTPAILWTSTYVCLVVRSLYIMWQTLFTSHKQCPLENLGPVISPHFSVDTNIVMPCSVVHVDAYAATLVGDSLLVNTEHLSILLYILLHCLWI